jgi:hypothetical protein
MDDRLVSSADSSGAAVPGRGGDPPRARARPARLTLVLLVVFLVSGATLMIDAFLVEPGWIEVNRTIEFVPAIPASQPDLTIIHLSDLHIGRLGTRERRAAAMINEARPDLILISGDLTRHGATPEDLEGFLGALRSTYGKFAVWGNEDYRGGVATDWGPVSLKRAGFRLLRNESVRLPRTAGRIHVAGLDDPVSGHDNLSLAMARIPRRDVCILLSHTPEIVRYLGNWDIDLVFAGHTHGGQVRLPLLGALWVPPGTRGFLEGWYDAGRGVRLHVSRGLGWSLVPARLLCRPRIDRITLRGGSGPERAGGGRAIRRSSGPIAPGRQDSVRAGTGRSSAAPTDGFDSGAGPLSQWARVGGGAREFVPNLEER